MRRRGAMRALLTSTILLLSIASGCGAGARFIGGKCRPVEHAARPAATAPVPAHADFAQLRAYRHYFSLRRVDEFAHHFAVYFDCIEPAVAYFAVHDDGRVEREGGWWGGLGVRPRDARPVPPAMARHAERARMALEGDYGGESDAEVVYRGSYRNVVVTEIVPLQPPGDPYKRLATLRSVTLEADRGLTKLSEAPASFEGGTSFLCWEDAVVGDCSQPWWIDFDASSSTGNPLLPALADSRSPATDARRDAFALAVLGAARARAAGEPGTPLEVLLARQGDSVLPADLAPAFSVVFTLYARPRDHRTEQASGALRIELSAADAVYGVARGTATTTIGGVTLHGTATVAAVAPPSRDTVGEQELTFVFAYELRDARGATRRAEVSIDGKLLVDRGAVAVLELGLPSEYLRRQHEPPLSQSFPGRGSFSSIAG